MFRAKTCLKRVFERAGYRLESVESRQTFKVMFQRAVEALLYERLRKRGVEFFFVQIGANDGISYDWIYRFVTANRLRGIVVEPLRDVFEELRLNYKDHPQVTALNLAIHRTARETDLYRVDPRAMGLPSWTKGIASLDPSHHKKSGIPSEHIIAERVHCTTLQELIEEQKITDIDYLQIDTEGYDYEVLKMVDFNCIRPNVIRFEHQLRAKVMSYEHFLDSQRLLSGAGYYLLMDAYDVVAYLP